jgi:hypothetical protein
MFLVVYYKIKRELRAIHKYRCYKRTKERDEEKREVPECER